MVGPRTIRTGSRAVSGSASRRRLASSWSSRSPPSAPSRTISVAPSPTAGAQRQLGVGGVLVCRMPLDRHIGLVQHRDERTLDRVEVADQLVGPAAESLERSGAAVRGDHQLGTVEPADVVRRQVAGCDHRHQHQPSSFARSTRLTDPLKRRAAHLPEPEGSMGRAAARAASTSFAGMTRIRFEGLRSHRRPHSQRCRAPLSSLGLCVQPSGYHRPMHPNVSRSRMRRAVPASTWRSAAFPRARARRRTRRVPSAARSARS